MAELVVGVATPVAVVLFGWILNRRLKQIDQAQWENRKIIEKRIALYDEIAPNLNLVYCFCAWVGYWKDITPAKMIETKRELDKIVNIYSPLIGEDFRKKYQSFIHGAFFPYQGPGKDAKILSRISGGNGDRRTDGNYDWDPAWDSLFDENGERSSTEINTRYLAVMDALRSSIGVDDSVASSSERSNAENQSVKQ